MTISQEDCEAYATWSEERYTRNCIAHNEHFELILLCWAPGQGTQIHDHDNKNCLVQVVSGTLLEKTYELNGESFLPTGSSILSAGSSTQANESNFLHSLKNYTTERTMSLHLYMAPIRTCMVFDPKVDEFKTVSMSYDTETTEILS